MNKLLLIIIIVSIVSVSGMVKAEVLLDFEDDFNDDDYTPNWNKTAQDAGSTLVEEFGQLKHNTGKNYAHTGVSSYTHRNFTNSGFYNISFVFRYYTNSTAVGHTGVFLMNDSCFRGDDCRDTVYYGVPTGKTIALLLTKGCLLSNEGLAVVSDDANTAWSCGWENVVFSNNTNIFVDAVAYEIIWVINLTSGYTAVWVDGTKYNEGTIGATWLNGLGEEFRINTHKSHYPYNTATDTFNLEWIKVYSENVVVPQETICSYQNLSSSLTLSANSSYCYNLTASNLYVDCSGYNLVGKGQVNDYLFTSSGNLKNLTIRNCNIHNYTNILFSYKNNNTFFVNNTVQDAQTSSETSAFLRMLYYYKNNHTILANNTFEHMISNNTDTEEFSENSDGCVLLMNKSNNSFSYNNFFQNITFVYVGGDGEGGKFLYKVSRMFCLEDYSQNQVIINNTVKNIVSSPFYIESSISKMCVNDSFFSDLSGGLSIYGSDFCFKNNFLNKTRIFYIFADNVSFYGNTIISDSSYTQDSEMIDLYGDDIRIYNNYIDGSNAFAGIGTNNNYNVRIINNTINNTEGQYNEHSGIYLNLGTFWVYNNTIENYNFTGDFSGGISWFQASEISGNTLRNGLGKGLFTIGGGFVFENNTISNVSSYDIYMEFGSNTGINNVFNKSNVYATSGAKYTNKYYLIVNVTNQTSGVSGATISVYNNNGTLQTSGVTNTTGHKTLIATEYIQSGKANYTSGCTGSTSKINCSVPLNITANYSSYENSTTTNLEYITYKDVWLNFVTANTCVCPGVGNDWNVNAGDYCFVNEDCDLTVGFLNIIGTGNFSVNATINCSEIRIGANIPVWMYPTGIIYIK